MEAVQSLNEPFFREIKVSGKKTLTAEAKKKATELQESLRKEESRLVKGVFKNIEAPGGRVEMAVLLHKGDPIRVYTFEDNHEYEIPLGVARHINRNCQYKKHKWLVDKDGRPAQGWDTPNSRYQFVSADYM